MNNLIINPQFIGSQQTHHKNYIGWISEEIIVLKIKRERERKPSSYYYGPVGPNGTTHTSSWRQQGWWRWPPQWFPPPAECQNRALDGITSEQRLAAAIKFFRVSAPRVLEYMWIYRPLIRANGAAGDPQAWVARPTPQGTPPGLWPRAPSSSHLPKLLGSLMF